jgi:hypothetical protein
MVSGQDDECGDNSTGPAWYAMFRGSAEFDGTQADTEVLDAVEGEGFCPKCITEAIERVRTTAGAILSQSSTEFISSTLYDDTQALETAWGECLVECADDDDDAEE